MESFFLAETLKYAHLLFSPDHFLHKSDYVYSTEGHLLRPLGRRWNTTWNTTTTSGTCASDFAGEGVEAQREGGRGDSGGKRGGKRGGTRGGTRDAARAAKRRKVLGDAVAEINTWPSKLARTCDRIGGREVLAGLYSAPGRGTCHMRERGYFDERTSRGAFAKASALLTREGKGKTVASTTRSIIGGSVNNIAAVGLALKQVLHGVVAKLVAAGESSEAVSEAVASAQIALAATVAAEVDAEAEAEVEAEVEAEAEAEAEAEVEAEAEAKGAEIFDPNAL